MKTSRAYHFTILEFIRRLLSLCDGKGQKFTPENLLVDLEVFLSETEFPGDPEDLFANITELHKLVRGEQPVPEWGVFKAIYDQNRYRFVNKVLKWAKEQEDFPRREEVFEDGIAGPIFEALVLLIRQDSNRINSFLKIAVESKVPNHKTIQPDGLAKTEFDKVVAFARGDS